MLRSEGQHDRKFLSDAIWNYSSLGVQASVGLALNFLIILKLGAGSLGVFNQIYAVYIISGQMAVFGLQDSAQKHVAEFWRNPAEQHLLSMAALGVAATTGLIAGCVLALLSGGIGQLAQSAEVGRGVFLIAPGLFVFTLNKVLMGILNGHRRMAAFATGQAVRALGILLMCIFIVLDHRAPSEFGLSFTIAEILLFLFLMVFVQPVNWRYMKVSEIWLWVSRHARFGSKAVVHGFLSEAFLRIDIVMLGIFVSDRAVGIYSFAAMFIEGIYQVPVVIRNIANPILVRLLALRENIALKKFFRRTALFSFLSTISIAAVIVAIYPYLSLFIEKEVVEFSYAVLLVLLAGLVVYSAFVPFDYIFLEAGRPGMQSVFMTINTIMNVLLNLSLIPAFGLYGACVATAIAFVFSCLLLNVLAIFVLGLHGGLLLKR